jgi:RimJ/RimL family protein N-acetyltransferase
MEFNIATPRLILKKHSIANYLNLNKWENDQELLYFNDCQPTDRLEMSLEESKKFVEDLVFGDSKTMIHYAIHKKKDDSFIGYGIIAFIDCFNGSCKLSIVIGEKNEWGQGYGKEALQCVIHFCFETLNMNRIGADIYGFNKRSIRLFKSLGFKREGVIREAVKKDSKYKDEFIFGLLKKEWIEKNLA